jgi:hypothetical protein
MGFLSTTLGKVMKSRTVWGAVILGAIPVLQAIAPMLPAGTKAGAVVGVILMIWTIYCRIRARQPLGPVIDTTVAKTIEAIHIIGATQATPAPGPETTTIANPQTATGKIMQALEVKGLVKALQ